MEKYKNYKISLSRNNDRINKLNTQINKKYDNIAKALKRKDQEKGQKLVQNHMTHIRKMEEQILRLEKVGKNIESVQQENIKSFIAWTKAN
jgi:DNA-binding FadR family transcriptional regulator